MSTSTEAAFFTKLSTDLNNYFLYVSSAIGIPLNIISALIFIRLINNKTNMGFLYACQCVTDLLVLLLQLLIFKSNVVFGRAFSAANNDLCKFISFLRRFSVHTSSMIPVLITFDRFVFVLYGHRPKIRRFTQKRYMAVLLILMLVAITVIDIPNFFYYLSSAGSCTNDTITDIFADVISIVLKTFVPFILMGLFNWFIIRRLIRNTARNKANGLVASLKKNKSIFSRKEYQFTIAVIVFDLYFLILNIPISVYSVFSDINNFSGVLKANPLMRAQYNLASAICNSIAFCVQTLSFFLYFGCNKLFRNVVMRVLGKLKCWRHLKVFKQVQPMTEPTHNSQKHTHDSTRTNDNDNKTLDTSLKTTHKTS